MYLGTKFKSFDYKKKSCRIFLILPTRKLKKFLKNYLTLLTKSKIHNSKDLWKIYATASAASLKLIAERRLTKNS
jgi:hypothetical protein